MWLDSARAVVNAKVEWQPTKHEHALGRSPRNETTAHATLHLLPSAPPELIRAAFKCLAQLHHPDKQGGDEEIMKRISDAYQRLLAA